jgi:hypothetical protein
LALFPFVAPAYSPSAHHAALTLCFTDCAMRNERLSRLLHHSTFTDYPSAGENPEYIVNRNPRQAVGYLARLGSILVRQTFSVLAAGPDRAIVQDLNLKE